MEGYSIQKPESDTQMAIRLMRTLDYQEEVRCQKRRYIVERWPENAKKHKTLGFLTEKCVPELDLREEKDILKIKSLVERSVTTLCGHRQNCSDKSKSCVVVPPPEFLLGKVQELSDLELVKMAPFLLCSLNKRSLKALLSALAGRHLTSNHRYIFEREIKTELVKLTMPSSAQVPPESLLKVVSVLRSPTSYRHALRLNNPHVKLFHEMPSSALAAAREAFTQMDKLPTRIVVEVRKMLMMDCNTDLQLSFGHRTHTETVNAVNKEVRNLLDSLEEGDSLPLRIEGALQVISLSARVLFGDDGGLTRLLRPSSPEQLSLENGYQAAFSRLEELEVADLLRIYNMVGKRLERPDKSKQHYIYELKQIFTGSIHCIYAGCPFPEDVAEALSMINDTPQSTAEEVNMELNKGSNGVQKTTSVHSLSKEIKNKRIRAEVDAVLDVSAQFRRVLWECYEAFQAYGMGALGEVDSLTSIDDARPSSMRVDLTNSESPQSLSLEVDPRNAEKIQLVERMQMKINLDGVSQDVADCIILDQKELHKDIDCFVQDVEMFSDEVATISYVLIGCVLKEVSAQCSTFLDATAVGYLQTGLIELQASSIQPSSVSGAKILPAPESSEYLGADKLVLDIAKKLKSIPKSVIQEVELRLGHQ